MVLTFKHRAVWAALGGALVLSACGGAAGDKGPRVRADAQSIATSAEPALQAGAVAQLTATATSGLAVSYSSATPSVCSVDAGSGAVTGLSAGSCSIVISQSGDTDWAAAASVTQTFTVAPNPHQTLSFATPPVLTLGSSATLQATASSRLAVSYTSLTPSVCSVSATTGLTQGLTLGDCTVAADQPGDATYLPAPQLTQTVSVQVPAGMTAPGVPQGVMATLGSNAASVIVSLSAIDSGGSPITGYTVVSQPAGITVQASSVPVTVSCPSRCSGYGFSIQATNAIGSGGASAVADVLTTFNVFTRFQEPDTQPRDSIFTGSFVLNSTTGAITGLAGQLTESMTGNAIGSAPYYDMTQVPLTYQLQSWRDAGLGGTFVASFAKNTTSTFSTQLGGDGWSPQAGIAIGGVYAGFPASYAASIKNSSVLIFVPDDPFAALNTAQIDKLAYADCAPGGMMGAVCMTATSVAGYGSTGTMSGYPVSQQLTKR